MFTKSALVLCKHIKLTHIINQTCTYGFEYSLERSYQLYRYYLLGTSLRVVYNTLTPPPLSARNVIPALHFALTLTLYSTVH